jgi:hypothetical protein
MAEAGKKSDHPCGTHFEADAAPDQPPSDQLGNVVDASDRLLLERFLHGQPEAAKDLYGRYAQRLQALAAAQSGTDLAQRVDPEDIRRQQPLAAPGLVRNSERRSQHLASPMLPFRTQSGQPCWALPT